MIPWIIIVILAGLGIFFGLFLSIANKKFAVEINPLIHEIEEILPKGQCGACGYAGCIGYAEAVANNPDVPVNLCIPGKEEVAVKIAELTGKNRASSLRRIAHIKCSGTADNAMRVFEYKGIRDCVSANLLQGGNKACKFGCVGLGSCIGECGFNALTMGKKGMPEIDEDKCTGCGKCQSACPKNIIEMIRPEAPVRVYCSSRDKGRVSVKYCSASCIGCRMCEKSCLYGAVKIENNLAVINSQICIEKCSDPVCVNKCPTKAIKATVSA